MASSLHLSQQACQAFVRWMKLMRTRRLLGTAQIKLWPQMCQAYIIYNAV